jgi:hypothetical protein
MRLQLIIAPLAPLPVIQSTWKQLQRLAIDETTWSPFISLLMGKISSECGLKVSRCSLRVKGVSCRFTVFGAIRQVKESFHQNNRGTAKILHR